MSNLRIRFHADARAEFREAVDFYDAQVLGLGDELAFEIDHTLQTIRSFPEVGRPYLVSTRRVLVPRFPFSIVYRLRSDEVVVVAIPHDRRKPGYWRSRR